MGRNEYVCECCGEIVGRKQRQMDHIEPMIPLTGWQGFDSMIDRLLADESGWQTLCKDCHSIKTKAENEQRKNNKKSLDK